MVGTMISADDLARSTTYYHQVGPRNRREAQVAAYYAAEKLKAKVVSIYYSGSRDDLYSPNLAADAREEFALRGIRVNHVEAYRTGRNDQPGVSDISILGRETCEAETDEVVFYAGRSAAFPAFLHGMRDACGRYPRILANDDVTLFALANNLRQDFPDLTLDYLSFATSAVWTDACDTMKPFFATYRAMFGEPCTENRDGQAMLAHDAIQVVLWAIIYVRRESGRSSITAGVLLKGIGDIRGDDGFAGASGFISYSNRLDPLVPENKLIVVLRVGPGTSTPEPVLLCGDLPDPGPRNGSSDDLRTVALARTAAAIDCPRDG
ncbi:hypothetical protein ACFP2T_32130 [Plantactinospora solaniradicis]|uniref:ABC transporter substrate-binding protein n=1 Tax=Plantactinospora solaniradicis TaxID=1723736 RepID=A0ABW1KH04_9ACTN